MASAAEPILVLKIVITGPRFSVRLRRAVRDAAQGHSGTRCGATGGESGVSSRLGSNIPDLSCRALSGYCDMTGPDHARIMCQTVTNRSGPTELHRDGGLP